MAIGTTKKDSLLNHYLRNTTDAAPAAVYVSLHSANPTGSGGSEIVGTGYAREVATFAAPSAGVAATDAEIEWVAGSAWGTVSHFGIWDAASGGNLIAYGAFSASQTVANGNTVKIPLGSLSVTAT